MAPVFFVDHPLAGALFGLTSLSITAIEVTDLRVRRQVGDQVKDGGTGVVFGVTMVFAVGGSLVATFGLPRTSVPGGWVIFLFGFTCAWVGIGVNRWARQSLGRAYRPVVTVIEGQQVVASGPYRIVRHPMYTGAILMCIGIGGLFGTWVGLGCWLLPPVALVRRIRVEETVLAQHLGPDYQRFADGRARLLPGVW